MKGQQPSPTNASRKLSILQPEALSTSASMLGKGYCSVRLTWDVFMPDLDRQLGTPSHWLPVASCKKGQKGRPSGRLHSDAQVSQQETPKTMHLRIGAPRMHSEGGKKETTSSVYFSFWQRSFPSPLSVTSRLEQATREFLENLPKVRNPVPNIFGAI